MQESDRMNEVKKKAIWDQWQQGHPMSVIARSVHRPPATVFSYLRYYGGISGVFQGSCHCFLIF